MRTHEGKRPGDNWQFDSDKETLEHFARMSQIHVALAPYFKDLVREYAQCGIPVIRPLFLQYASDSKCFDIHNEYLLGSDMLVAPILEDGAMRRRVYLPEDKWLLLWSGEPHVGGDYEVKAPWGFPPVFVRQTSCYLGLFQSIRNTWGRDGTEAQTRRQRAGL